MSVTTILKQGFAFLRVDYGLKYRRTPSDKWDRRWVPSVSFADEKVGVLVEYDARDEYLDVCIFDLKGGAFPMRAGRIDSAQGYTLNAAAYLAGPDHTVGSWRDEIAKASGVELDFAEYVSLVARQLTKFADDLLKGDFSRADEIRRAKDQMRARHP